MQKNDLLMNESTSEIVGNSLLAPLLNTVTDGQSKGVVLAPMGEHPHSMGVQIVDAKTLTRLLAAANEMKTDMPVDYGHGSIKQGGGAEGGKAAGWIEPSTIRIKNGALVGDIKWTDAGGEYVSKGEYRYLSPVFEFDRAKSVGDRLFITRMVNTALTNNPNIADMPALNEKPETENKETKEMKEFLKLIANAMGITDELTENTAMTKIAEMVTAGNTSAAAIAANEKVMGELHTLTNSSDDATLLENVTLLAKPAAKGDENEMAAMRAELDTLRTIENGRVIDAAMGQGQIAPNQKEWAQKYQAANAAGFKEYLANVAPGSAAPITATGMKTADAAPAGDELLDNSIVAQFTSITAEDVSKLATTTGA